MHLDDGTNKEADHNVMIALEGHESCCWGPEWCDRPESIQKNPCIPKSLPTKQTKFRSCWPRFATVKVPFRGDCALLEARLNLLITESLAVMGESATDLSEIASRDNRLVLYTNKEVMTFSESQRRFRELSKLLRASSRCLEQGELSQASEMISRAEGAVIIMKKRSRLSALSYTKLDHLVQPSELVQGA